MTKRQYCTTHGWVNFVRGYDDYKQESFWYCPACDGENRDTSEEEEVKEEEDGT
jgi:hypothetical protein